MKPARFTVVDGWLCLAILAAVLVAFNPVLDGEFLHWDDDLNITHNPRIEKLNADSLHWMFTDHSHMRRYVPLSWLNWAMLRQLFGLNPYVFHLQALLIHAANALLLYWLLRRFISSTPEPEDTESSAWFPALCAGAGALLWALHPLRVEVVGWANCQIYAQSLFFALLALLFYLRATENSRGSFGLERPALWLSVGCFVFSLLTYPIALAFPAVLLVLDIFLLKRLPLDLRRWRESASLRALLEKIPFVVATVAVLAITLAARARMSGIWEGTSALEQFGWGSRAAQALYIWAYYLWKTWLPLNLSPVYTQLVSFNPLDWPFVLSAVAVLGGTAAFIWLRHRQPLLLALWLCHLALLVPMLGLTEHPHYPNDRYNYLSAIVWSVLVVAVLWQFRVTRAGPLLLIAVLLVAGGCGLASFQQSKMWRNNSAFFGAILERLGNDPYRSDIHWRLGRVLARKGQHEAALKELATAVEINPKRTDPMVEMAGVYVHLGQLKDAQQWLERSLQLNPKDALAHYNLAVVLEKLGKAPGALEHYQKAVALNPADADYRLSLAGALDNSNRSNEAEAHVLEALRLAPESPRVLTAVGSAMMRKQKPDEALFYLSGAIEKNPQFVEAHHHIGILKGMMGRSQEALGHLSEVVRLKPDFAEGHLALGVAHDSLGKRAEAAACFREALRLNPDSVPALKQLGWLLVSETENPRRNAEEALKVARRAVVSTGEQDAEALELLAAACALGGLRQEEIDSVTKALAAAKASGQTDRTARLARRLESFGEMKPSSN